MRDTFDIDMLTAHERAVAAWAWHLGEMAGIRWAQGKAETPRHNPFNDEDNQPKERKQQ